MGFQCMLIYFQCEHPTNSIAIIDLFFHKVGHLMGDISVEEVCEKMADWLENATFGQQSTLSPVILAFYIIYF